MSTACPRVTPSAAASGSLAPSSSVCGNKCNYVFKLYSNYTQATHAPSGYPGAREAVFPPLLPGNFTAVSVIRFANRISRAYIDDIGETVSTVENNK